MKPEISILIVNFNTGNLLEKCLLSIDKYKGDLNLEIIIVDNDSRDESKNFLEKLTNDKQQTINFLKIILLDKNVGFAKANNLAYQKARAEYIFLLNPDTELKNNTIQNLKLFFESKENIGVVGPKLLFPDNKLQNSVRKFPKLWDQLIILSKLHNLFPRLAKNYLQLDFDYSRSQEVDQIMGAAIFTNKEAIDSLRKQKHSEFNADLKQKYIFDPGFKRNFEDVDLCKRIKDAGYKIFYISNSELTHSKGGSFHGSSFKPSIKRQLYFNLDMFHYLVKHNPIWQLPFLIIFQLVNLVITLFLLLITTLIPSIKSIKKRQN